MKGDWVVRNRCEATGHEEYLVAADKFKGRYQSTGKPAGQDGWQEYRPLGKVMRFLVLQPEHGTFAFTAPWGELMVAKPGDAIVQDPEAPRHLSRGGRGLRLHLRDPRVVWGYPSRSASDRMETV